MNRTLAECGGKFVANEDDDSKQCARKWDENKIKK